MIQEIAPRHLDNQYHSEQPRRQDCALVFSDDRVLVSHPSPDALALPDFGMVADGIDRFVYLFSVDDARYFLCAPKPGAQFPAGFAFENVRAHRRLLPKETVYAEMTAWHLYVWYRDNRFCGRCGAKTVHDAKLRMLRCPDCGNMIFPKICPAVIVCVMNGDRLLLTRYNGRAYKNYALIAGFTEIGETAEETVRREVMEEVGVRVKNIRYYCTQPWGIDTDLLLGFFCELDGDDRITMDAGELSLAGWYRKGEFDYEPDGVSLTNDMIGRFLDGRVPPYRGE